MKVLIKTFLLIVFIALSGFSARAQEAFMDNATKFLLDSLDQQIKNLNNEIPRLSANRAINYYYKKQELDRTIFLSHYHRYLFDEDTERAQNLIESRLKAVRKRNDSESVKFYTEYRKQITQEIIEQRKRYQYLFAKEKNFKKEFYRFIEVGDEYSLKRALFMTDQALNYARENQLPTVINYLVGYKVYAEAALFNYYSEFDLARLAQSESQFNKVFLPMIESDSLEIIKEAGLLVEQCENYSEHTRGAIGSNFFALQKNLVATSVSDYYARKGNYVSLSSMGEQSIVARFDTLNHDGIYKWQNNILVVGHFQPKGKFDYVQSGEAVIHADRKLLEYIRINRLAKLGKEVEMGHTFFIPFIIEEEPSNFCYNPAFEKLQYMICYTQINDPITTRKISKFLPPVEFEIHSP